MSDQPYHVVGGSFPPAPQQHETFRNLLRHRALEAPTGTHGSRRRKLWELPHKFHCPVVGVCFGVDELRALMGKVMPIPRDTNDYVLHTSTVGAIEERCPLAELLQKNMEKRFQLTIRRFATAKTPDALQAFWQETVRSGGDIPASLWAAWTHPACDGELEQEIYGDIHMLQHQLGSRMRDEQGILKRLHGDKSELLKQLEAARRDNEVLRHGKSREIQSLGLSIAELRVELAGKDAWGASVSAQLERLRQTLPDLAARQALARRANDAEARASALNAHAAALEREIAGLKRQLALSEGAPRQPAASEKYPASTSSEQRTTVDIAGKCVLCVGGRSGAVDAYRQMIEQRGGRFLHHDGGLEESLHRIDAALATADLVICQAGCISHNAYWRVKEQCKRTGKPCLYMKNSGVSGLSRLIRQNDESHPLLTD